MRTALRSISAAAIAGGLTLGLGVSAPATAMPVHDRAESLGRLCHAAAQARTVEHGVAPSSIEGLPGLRCGQAFGMAGFAADDDTAYDDTGYDDATADATETEDSDAYEEAAEPEDVGESYPEQSDDADDPEEGDDAYEADEPAEESDSDEAEDSEGSVEQDDSEESHEQEDADHDDEGDDVDDEAEHSEHHDD
jgi:hypothetical protein